MEVRVGVATGELLNHKLAYEPYKLKRPRFKNCYVLKLVHYFFHVPLLGREKYVAPQPLPINTRLLVPVCRVLHVSKMPT